MTKEIPINCKICEYCIEDYDTGKLICNFDESNTELLTLGVCGEFKIGKIRLVEFLEKLEEKYKNLNGKIEINIQHLAEINNILPKIEALESVLGTLLKTLESQILMQKQGFDFDINIYEEKVKDLIKQLEGKK